MRLNFLPVLVLSLLFAGGFSAFAAQPQKKAVECSGEWTGVVTLTRNQTQSDNKTVERVSGRGKDTRNWEMKVNYQATVTISEAPGGKGGVVTKATITHEFSNTETNTAVEKNSCDRGKTWQDMTGTFTSQTTITGTGKEDGNVSIGLNSDGTYSIGVGVGEIDGIINGSETSTFSGQCTPKQGKNTTLPPTRTKIQGQSMSSDGSHRVDPENPNQLSGSYTLTLPGGVVQTISWSLQRCGAPLRITDLKFEDMKFPKWDDWHEINEQAGTVDGNWVKVKAKVFNPTAKPKTGEVMLKETYKGDKWDAARPDQPLKDQSFTVTLEGGEEREVELLWNSSGYAWFDDGRPRLVQRIKAEAWENYKKVDEMTKNLKINPRPLIIVPGVGTDQSRFDLYQNLLTTTHSYGWKSSVVVDVPNDGKVAKEGEVLAVHGNRSVYDHAANLTSYLKATRSASNAWHVDMLAHDTGGLVARLYIQKEMEALPDGYPVVRNLLMMATPNNGLPCTGLIIDDPMFRDNPITAKELGSEQMANFNKYVTQRKNVKFSALAGNSNPILCGLPMWNDGLVSVDSATYGVEDFALTSDMHNQMINTQTFNDYVKPHLVVGPRGEYPLAGKK